MVWCVASASASRTVRDGLRFLVLVERLLLALSLIHITEPTRR